MPTLVLTVEDAFDITQRGVAITGNIPGDWVENREIFVSDGETLSLRRPDGTSVAAVFRSIERFTEPLGTPYGEIPKLRGVAIRLEGVASKDDVPRGTKVITENESP